MLRRIIAGAAVVGALTIGSAGAAGAAGTTSTSSGPASSTTTSTTTPCSNLAAILKQYDSNKAKVGKHLHKEVALESRERKAGNRKLASFIGRKVHIAQVREKQLKARLHQAVAQCGGSGSSTANASTSGH